MPIKNLIDVRVMLDAEVAHDYEISGEEDSRTKMVRYIQVKAGQNFGVSVAWLEGFEVHPEIADWGLKYEIRKHDEINSVGHFFPGSQTKHRNGLLIESVMNRCRGQYNKDKATGEYESVMWAFEELETSKRP